jgi:hypothetical protein
MVRKRLPIPGSTDMESVIQRSIGPPLKFRTTLRTALRAEKWTIPAANPTAPAPVRR